VRQRRDAALFPNYFGQTCLRSCAVGLEQLWWHNNRPAVQ